VSTLVDDETHRNSLLPQNPLQSEIIVAPDMQIVQDVTRTQQQKIENLREVKTCLEPIQQAIGEEILSSAMILTPQKMQKALAKNPWEVLVDVRPLNLVTPPNNPDLVPVAFVHNGIQFIGWQMRGTLPILFDCQFDISPTSKLLTPSEPVKKVIKKQSSFLETIGFAKKPVSKPVVTKPKTGEEFNFEVVTVNAQGKITNRNRHTKTQVIEKVNGVPLEMVYIPSGEFMMGSPKDKGGDGEKPQHKVTIKQPFYMGKYPITQAQWQAVMGDDTSKFKGKNKPVESISWNSAITFCEKLAKITANDYRLPSEAEWEYACRAGTTTPFYFGETITPDLANYDGNYTYGSGPKGVYRKQTTEVGQFSPNAFGLYDMHGNVYDWVADSWHENYKNAPNDGGIWKEGANKSYRVLRGGSWCDFPGYSRAAYRNRFNPDNRNYGVGFRVVRRVART